MELAQMVSVAFAFAGSCVAQKCADGLVSSSWKLMERHLMALFHRDPTPDDLGPTAGGWPAEISDAASTVYDHSPALRRAQLARPVLQGAKILWVDDQPENNLWERTTFRFFGAEVEAAETTRSALAYLGSTRYDLIISDIARARVPDEGVRALPAIITRAPDTAIVFYVGQLDAAAGIPRGARGITNRPDELLHLALDVLERTRV